MREKFKSAREPNERELLFIQVMEKTHDTYGLSYRTIELLYHITPRLARKYKERYNNHKYLNHIPQGEIHTVNGLFKLISPTSKFARRYILQDERDFICALIKRKNRKRNLGDIQSIGQQTIQDYLDMDVNELVEIEQKLKVEMESEVE